jgi:hypothetical protein
MDSAQKSKSGKMMASNNIKTKGTKKSTLGTRLDSGIRMRYFLVP